jgi:diaminohydroxyphosphoribosylaminopyrimidine deaminase/5-amino-6-(5-phosphoribosylamino)uracil reductase
MDPVAALDRAVELALRGRGEVEPNPCVGAVVVKADEVVGEGWHHAWGEPHAEVAALAEAGECARGATVVVTLEPCCTHGKTGPCTEALLAAGVARVIVGAIDPNPDHAGKGVTLLRAAGVDVVELDHAPSRALADAFAPGLTTERPHVLLKWAMSADGSVAGPDGEPVALTGQRANARSHHWRAHVDAILVGIQTVLNDDPQLTVREQARAARPLRRVVLDPSLRLPLHCRLVDTAGETPTWALTRDDADQQPEAVLEAEGVRVLRVPGDEDWLQAVLATLRLEGVKRLMVEGGPRTHAAFLAAGLWDQLAVYLTPKTLGPGALPALPDRDLPDDPAALAEALGLADVRIEELGDDVLLRGVRPPSVS